MVKLFNKFLIISIFSFLISYSSKSYAAKLTCECIYSEGILDGSLCLSVPSIEIQTFLFKNYIKVDEAIYEILSKNEDQIIATNTTNLSYGNFMMTINRSSGKALATLIYTKDMLFKDGSKINEGHTISRVYQCSKKKEKLF